MSARIAVPSLRTRASTTWVGATAVVVLAACAYLAVTRPADRAAAAVVAALLVVAGAGLASGRQWLDPVAGAVGWQRFGIVRVTLRWSDVTAVELVPNRGGALLLRLRSARRARHLVLTLLTPYVRASQPPDVLLALADAVAAAGPRLRGGDAVAAGLCAQAGFLASGGTVERSPFAARLPRAAALADRAGPGSGPVAR